MYAPPPTMPWGGPPPTSWGGPPYGGNPFATGGALGSTIPAGPPGWAPPGSQHFQGLPRGSGQAGSNAEYYTQSPESEYATNYWDSTRHTGNQYKDAFPTMRTEKVAGQPHPSAKSLKPGKTKPQDIPNQGSHDSFVSEASTDMLIKPRRTVWCDGEEDRLLKLDRWEDEEEAEEARLHVCMILLLAVILTPLICCSIYLMFVSIETWRNEDFEEYTQLGGGWAKFFLFLYIVAALVTLFGVAMTVVLVQRGKPSEKLLGVIAVLGGLATILLCTLATTVVEDSRFMVYSTANLVCQDVTLWKCDAAMITPARRRLSVAEGELDIPRSATGQASSATVRRRLVEVFAATARLPLMGIADRSMLDQDLSYTWSSIGQAAMGYVNGLGDVTHISGSGCQRIHRVCQPPFGFGKGSCVCSGDWTRAHTTTLTTSTSSTTTTTTTSTMTTTWSGSDRRLADDIDRPGFDVVGARRLLVQAPPPWYSTEGLYCEQWSQDGATNSGPRWCFVDPNATCDSSPQPTLYRTAHFRSLAKSSGPCGSAVETRSEVAIRGENAMDVPISGALVLGLVVLLAGICCCGIGYWPDAKPVAAPKLYKESDEERRRRESAELKKQFEEHKDIAVDRLTESTPDQTKLKIYAYYKQATVGSASSQGSGVQPMAWERRKMEQYFVWQNLGEMSKEEAMRQYITTVKRLPVNF